MKTDIKIIHRVTAAVLLVLCAAGCESSRVDPMFLSNDENALVVAGVEQFKWDDMSCQMSYSREKKEFRVFTDTMSDYYCITMSETPLAQGMRLDCSVTWTSTDDITTKTGLDFRVEQVDGNGKAWLWNRKERIGIIVQVIE